MQHEYDQIFNNLKWQGENFDTLKTDKGISPSLIKTSSMSGWPNDSWSMGGEVSSFPNHKKQDFDNYEKLSNRMSPQFPEMYNDDYSTVLSQEDHHQFQGQRQRRHLTNQELLDNSVVPSSSSSLNIIFLDNTNETNQVEEEEDNQNNWYHENITIDDYLEDLKNEELCDENRSEPTQNLSINDPHSSENNVMKKDACLFSSPSQQKSIIIPTLDETYEALDESENEKSESESESEQVQLELESTEKDFGLGKKHVRKNNSQGKINKLIKVEKEKKQKKKNESKKEKKEKKEKKKDKKRKLDEIEAKISNQEKNKQSAKLYRDRKKQEANWVETRCNFLLQENARMKGEISSIQNQILEYKDFLSKKLKLM